MADALSERELLALQVIDLAKARVLADNHFLSAAVGRLVAQPAQLEAEFCTDGRFLMYDADRVIAHFRDSRSAPKFNLLHTVAHCLFLHPYVGASVDRPMWDLACDIAVERVVAQLGGARPGRAGAQVALALERIERDLGGRASAEKVYRRLREGWWADEVPAWMALMRSDSHDAWYAPAHSGDGGEGEGSAEGTEARGGIGRVEGPADSTDSASSGAGAQRGGSRGEGSLQEAEGRVCTGHGAGSGARADGDGAQGRGATGTGRRARSSEADEPLGEGGGRAEGAVQSEAAHAQPGAAAQSEGAAQLGLAVAHHRSWGEGAGGVVGAVDALAAGARLRTVALPARDRARDRGREQAEWRQVATSLAVNLQTMSAKRGGGLASFVDELRDAARPRMDYADFLRRFATMGEVMRLSDDEFDHVFYTYGLQLYGSMPLVEPLEYREERRVREFVVVIDTSGSVQGEAVRGFVEATFGILRATESFFDRVHLRILQCDAQVRSDDRIASLDELREWGRAMTVTGGGGTDFRPAFEYVDALVDEGAFQNLGGLVYFTDGWGTYPSWTPRYKVAFVFHDDDHRAEDVPPWAVQTVLDRDALDRMAGWNG